MASATINPLINSYPTDPPEHTNLAGKVFRSDLGTAVQVYGQVTAGAAKKGWLLRWHPEQAKWFPYGADAGQGHVTLDVGAPALLAGRFHGRWGKGERSAGDFCFLVEVGVTFQDGVVFMGTVTL